MMAARLLPAAAASVQAPRGAPAAARPRPLAFARTPARCRRPVFEGLRGSPCLIKAKAAGGDGYDDDDDFDVEAFIDKYDVYDEDTGEMEARGSCYGCGAGLQMDFEGEAGYISREKFSVKSTHRQLGKVLCGRCDSLHNGGMVPAVADFSMIKLKAEGANIGVADVRRLISPEELRRQLAGVREKKAVVVKVVDLLDVSGSFLKRVRDLVGRNPIVLIATKVDLLPKGTSEADVVEWLWGLTERKRLNVVGVHLVSSKTGKGINEAAAGILSERRGRDVYVLGAANVGKSAFVNALLGEMKSFSSRHFDPSATNAARTRPTESAMPGTTLGTIALKAFSSGGLLFDTPGVHLHHRVAHMLTPAQLADVHPRKKLAPYVPGPPPPPGGDAQGAAGWLAEGGPEGYSFLWGGLARVDVVAAPPTARLAFYGPPAMRVRVERTEELMTPAEAEAEAEVLAAAGGRWGEGGEELSVEGAVGSRGGLRVARQVAVPLTGEGALADIDVSGLAGWVSVNAWEGVGGGEVRLRVWAPVGVEVFVRPPLPVKEIRSPRKAPAGRM